MAQFSIGLEPMECLAEMAKFEYSNGFISKKDSFIWV
jgi:hypothetical protein